jgi:hypothetical protein
MSDNTNTDNMKTNTTDVNDDDKLKSEYELNEEDLVFYNDNNNEKKYNTYDTNEYTNEDTNEDTSNDEYNNKSEQVYGGGFSLNKAVIKAGVSPLQLFGVGGSAFGEPTTPNLSSSYALPSWAYSNGGYKKGIEESINERMYKTETLEDDDEYVSNDLHDRLLHLVRADSKLKDSYKSNKENNSVKTKKQFIKKTKKNKKYNSVKNIGKKKSILLTKKKRVTK